jgi:N-acyl-D-amino-acid deacylase
MKLMRRRRFLCLAGSTAGWGCLALAQAVVDSSPLPSFDREMKGFMAARKVPGGALGIWRRGKLIYAQGYGQANVEQAQAVRPHSLFRLASVSKPITALAMLKLVEQGKAALEQPLITLPAMARVLGEETSQTDPRWRKITLLHLLQHTGGWDRGQSPDPMFQAQAIARELGCASPPTPAQIIQHMRRRKLDFEPGQKHAYSNFGYCLLGRVIEAVSGQSYETFVQDQILRPTGIRAMRLGATLPHRAAPGEVRYYLAKPGEGSSVFPDTPARVPHPYGTFCLEAMDAHGGWIGSVVDLLRLAHSLTPSASHPLLKPSSLRAMYAPPAPPVSREANGLVSPAYYGCGWMVRPLKGSLNGNYWHQGSLPGTHTLWVRLGPQEMSWAALFNQRSDDAQLPDSALDGALHRAAAEVRQWPTEDLFAKFAARPAL